MTKIIINKMSFKHFKGFKSFELDLNGRNAVISGRNGTGKTSVFDGFLWLLFGKDSKGLKLNPKMLDENNQEILGLEPEVEAELVVNGQVVVLKRVLKETWTLPTGKLEKVRGSDTTKYFKDNVPMKEKEWKEYIATFGSETLLQLLSDATLFMRLKKWEHRRELLIDMTGLTDQDIMDQSPELKELTKFLDGKTVPEMKEILIGQKKEIKKNIEGMPARIQENQDMIDRLELDKINKDELEAQLAKAQKVLEQKENDLVAVKNQDAAVTIDQEIAKLNTKLIEEKNRFSFTKNMKTDTLEHSLQDIQKEGVSLRKKVSDTEVAIERLRSIKKSKADQKEHLLNDFHELKAMTFDEHKKECVMCGQTLPPNQVAEMVKKFHVEKAQNLESNISVGKKLAVEIEEVEKQIIEQQQTFEANNALLKKAEDDYRKVEAELKAEIAEIGNFEDSDEYKQIQTEIKAVESKRNNLSATNQEAVIQAQKERDEAKIAVNELVSQTFKFDQAETTQTRIDELRKEDKELKAQNDEVSRKLFLIDEFTRKKVKCLEETINSNFSMVKFKLFDTLGNGAVKEKCEALINGVDYSKFASNGERARCDLDIVSGLSKGYSIKLPVFLDNAESITEPYEFDGQLIELFALKEPFKVEVF